MTSLSARWLFPLWGSLVLFGACNSGDETVSEYRDNRGRVCSVSNEIRLAPASCDRDARPVRGCVDANGQPYGKPCYVVMNSPLDTGEMQNCDTCCDSTGRPALPTYQDCAPITCDNDSDCVYGEGRCVKRFCYDFSGSAGKPSYAGSGNVTAGVGGAPAQGGTSDQGGAPAQGGAPVQGGAPTTVPGGSTNGLAGSPAAGAFGLAGSPAAGAFGLAGSSGSGGAPGLGLGGFGSP